MHVDPVVVAVEDTDSVYLLQELVDSSAVLSWMENKKVDGPICD
jgi:hypothetical protein